MVAFQQKIFGQGRDVVRGGNVDEAGIPFQFEIVVDVVFPLGVGTKESLSADQLNLVPFF